MSYCGKQLTIQVIRCLAAFTPAEGLFLLSKTSFFEQHRLHSFLSRKGSYALQPPSKIPFRPSAGLYPLLQSSVQACLKEVI